MFSPGLPPWTRFPWREGQSMLKLARARINNFASNSTKDGFSARALDQHIASIDGNLVELVLRVVEKSTDPFDADIRDHKIRLASEYCHYI
jgi:hypothetical protein